jgi:hypothetical protein
VNLVDVLKNQLAGEVGKKLGGLVGANESEMGKILGAGLPSVLSGLGGMASSKSGADKLAKAIDGMDSSSFGDLGKMLGGGASAGGSMLSGLFGGSVVDGIASVVAKFTGINVTIVKTALGYLAPMVLGSVGASFKGAKPDGAGIAKLFSEQKSNIASAMPAGLSLNSVPGFQALTGNVASTAAKAVEETGSGLGKLLVPGAVIAALIAAALFFMNSGTKKPVDTAPKMNSADYQASMGQAKNAGVDAVKTSVTGMMDGLFSSLDGIKDAAGAESAMPAIKEMASKVDGLGLSLKAIPEAQRSMIGDLIKTQLDKLNPIIERVTSLPGIGDSIKQLLMQLKEKLTGLIG